MRSACSGCSSGLSKPQHDHHLSPEMVCACNRRHPTGPALAVLIAGVGTDRPGQAAPASAIVDASRPREISHRRARYLCVHIGPQPARYNPPSSRHCRRFARDVARRTGHHAVANPAAPPDIFPKNNSRELLAIPMGIPSRRQR